MIHFTYETKNHINGKTYLGVHSTKNPNDGYMGTGKRLLEAFEVFGKENFSTIHMSYFDTREKANEEEEFLVDQKWIDCNANYNSALGGGNSMGWKVKDTSNYSNSNKRRWKNPDYNNNPDKISKTLSKNVLYKEGIYTTKELGKLLDVQAQTIRSHARNKNRGISYIS